MISWIMSLLLFVMSPAPAQAFRVLQPSRATLSGGDEDKDPGKKAGEARVNRLPDAKQQLKLADEQRRGIRGKGEARKALVTKAIAHYAAVLEYYPDAKSETAMSAFRMGELYRSAAQLNEARDSFAKVVTNGSDRKLAARAMFETGHLYRRAKEIGKALETYRKTATDFTDEAGTRDDSLYWIGMIHQQNKEYDKARESWRAVADQGADPQDRIRAFDRIAGSFIKEAKREQASKTLEEAKSALHDAASEPTGKGSRVRKALERMSSIRGLERLDERESRKDDTKNGSVKKGGVPEKDPVESKDGDDEDSDDDDEDLRN